MTEAPRWQQLVACGRRGGHRELEHCVSAGWLCGHLAGGASGLERSAAAGGREGTAEWPRIPDGPTLPTRRARLSRLLTARAPLSRNSPSVLPEAFCRSGRC